MTKECYLYFIQAGGKGPIKIGIAKNVENRLMGLQTGNAIELNVIKKFKFSSVDRAKELEQRFQRFFHHTKMKGEWFRYKPFTVRYINNLILKDDEVYGHLRTWEDAVFNLDVWHSFSGIDRQIQSHLEDLVVDGDYNSVEYVVSEIVESIRITTGINLDGKDKS